MSTDAQQPSDTADSANGAEAERGHWMRIVDELDGTEFQIAAIYKTILFGGLLYKLDLTEDMLVDWRDFTVFLDAANLREVFQAWGRGKTFGPSGLHVRTVEAFVTYANNQKTND